jgi:hypothetical protein
MNNRLWNVLLLCMVAIINSSCNREDHITEIDFRSPDFVIRGPSDELDSERQFNALRQADPEADARLAYARGDLQLLATTQEYFNYVGVPLYDPLVRVMLERYGYKVIYVSRELGNNEEFRQLKERYEIDYNKTLRELASKHGIPKR